MRSQLSRPSEGLISHYNLTIFLLASELRVFSHMLKLVQSRTLHLQRVVHANPRVFPFPGTPGTASVDDVLSRIRRLEARFTAATDQGVAASAAGRSHSGVEQAAAVARDVRDAMQPELDALNRAVRRYEKRSTLLQLQTDARFSGLDERLDDAMALVAAAAAAAKSRTRGSHLAARAAGSAAALALFPAKTALRLLMLPPRLLAALVARAREAVQPWPRERGRAPQVAGKAPPPRRCNGDVPGREARE